MNAITKIELPAIGAPLAGGFYTGQILIAGALFALIVAPKAEGQIEDGRWNKSTKSVKGAESFFDGQVNTLAMAEAGSALARKVLDLRIGDHDDWYLPSRDELEIIYRNLKPTAEENWTGYRSGENPSAVSPTYPYTSAVPAQTALEAFRDGGAEAFDQVWYWTSTEYEPSPDCAWMQVFNDGGQGSSRKDGTFRARAVRRLPL